MKNKGFIKLYRNVLTKPELTDLVAEQGAAGLGVYIMVMLYLSQCDDYDCRSATITKAHLPTASFLPLQPRLASPAVTCVRSSAAIICLIFKESVSKSHQNRH